MQSKFIASAIAAVAIAAIASPALAGSFAKGCTKEPQSAWKPSTESEAKAVSLGYKVSKSKTSGSCYEVYATKDGKKFELFFNPVDGQLVHTAAK